jgi:anti-anti-sigma factor
MAAASHWSNQLVVRREDLGGAVCLTLTGELDLASVSTLQAQFQAIAQSEDHVIVEMSGLRYIDSTGAKALLDAHRLLSRTGRRIVLASVQSMARRIIDVMGIEQAIPMFPTVEAALEYLRGEQKP